MEKIGSLNLNDSLNRNYYKNNNLQDWMEVLHMREFDSGTL